MDGVQEELGEIGLTCIDLKRKGVLTACVI